MSQSSAIPPFSSKLTAIVLTMAPKQDRELLIMDKDPVENGQVDNGQPAITLAWQEVNVYASVVDQPSTKSTNSFANKLKFFGGEKRTFKRILDNVSGYVSSGTCMAIMGSSGAGKSTLMSTLAYRRPTGTIVHGDIAVNGTPMGAFMHKLSGFVYQDDIFVGTLTVREHLNFMIQLKLRQRFSREEINARIEQVLARAVLNKNCLNRKIGEDSDTKKVLSGGEKKRLSIATELISEPLILFCDEPTTGLDSYNAQHVMTTMKNLAKAGTIIICTIHQPSQAIFEQLDQVMFLADGKLSYTGSPKGSIEFFQGLGLVPPEGSNPACYLMSALSGNEKRSSKWISDQFAVTKMATDRDNHISKALNGRKQEQLWQYLEGYRRPVQRLRTFWFIIYLLTYRTLLNVARDPTVQIIRLVQKVVSINCGSYQITLFYYGIFIQAIAIMCGLCFYGSLNLDQIGIQAVQGAIFITISENTFHAMYSVVAVFPNDFPIFIRERKSGLYNIFQYYISNILGMLPGLLMEPLAFVCIFYFLVGFQLSFDSFLLTCLITVLVINVATACGYFFSVTFNSVAFGMAYLVPFDYILMITSGVFIKLSTLPSYLQWMKFMSWFMYAAEGMSIIQWAGIEEICEYNLFL